MTATFVPSRTLIHGGGSVPLSEARPGHSAMGVEMGDEDEDMDVDVMEEADEQGGASLLARRLVVPGQLVTDDPQFMRGHGTYIGEDEKVIASVAGTVNRVNKLLSVKSLRFRYEPQIGDLVVGRISEVGPKRWKVDIAGKQDAVLQLASINLPGGILRRRTTDDELQMRTFFTEGDLLVAEVQQLYADGGALLHTRSLKYGKLRNGVFVSIPPMLAVRSKSHMYSIGNGVHCILGTNGYVWVSKDVKTNKSTTVSITRLDEEANEAIYSNENEEIDMTTRREIARVCNCISALANEMVPVSEATLRKALEASNVYTNLADLLLPDVQNRIADEVLHGDD